MRESATATKRWGSSDLLARLAGAPDFRGEPVSEETLNRICEAYTLVTGDPIFIPKNRPPKKRNLVAAAYRIHGDDFLPYVADLFARNGTAQDLLGILRTSPPRNTSATAAAAPEDSATGSDTRTVPTPVTAPAAPTVDRGWTRDELDNALGPGGADDSLSTWEQFAEQAAPVLAMEGDDARVPPPRTASTPDSLAHVRCADYRAHQLTHRRVGNGWVCDSCTVLT